MLLGNVNAAPVSTSGLAKLQASAVWQGLSGPIQPFLEAVRRGLETQVESFHPAIANYARYALTNQGKQLRPALVALSGGIYGPPGKALVEVAVIIEMIHLATLVHDDIMDEADVRRARPTLAVRWGNDTAVLVGDCLFAQALQLASSFPTTDVCRAVAAATNAVCTGEIIQTHQRQCFDLRRDDYLEALRMKTGELFALSCEMGAWLSGGGEEGRRGLRAYGLALGTAYQIYDDCLDVFGTEAEAGKSLGTDLARGKPTLPVLAALEQANLQDRKRLLEMLQKWRDEDFSETVELLRRYDALNIAQQVIQDHLGLALGMLDKLELEVRKTTALRGLCEFLAQQTQSLGVTLADARTT